MKKILVNIWEPAEKNVQNFGEVLGVEIVRKLGFEPVLLSSLKEDEVGVYTHVVIPIGTAFSKGKASLPKGLKKCFWGCGMGSDMRFRLSDYKDVKVFGVRGIDTKRILRIEEDMPLIDPGFLAPRFWEAPEMIEGLVAYGAHIHIPTDFSDEWLDQLDVEEVFDAKCTFENFETILRKILEPAFLWTSSLHMAIIRAAYKRPWCFKWPKGYAPEFPFKYRDLTSSIGIDFDHSPTNYREGKRWYDRHGSKAVISEEMLDELVEIFPENP